MLLCKQETVYVAYEKTHLNIRRDGADELAKGDWNQRLSMQIYSQRMGALTTEELNEQDDEEHETIAICACSALPKTHRPNHQDPVDKRAQDRVRNFSKKLADGEDVGRVDS